MSDAAAGKLWASAMRRRTDNKWINFLGKNLSTTDGRRAEFSEMDARKAHSGMAHANAGKGNPNAGI